MYSSETMIVLIQTDFPEPVVPAISKCGIEVKSPIIGFPDMLLPSAIGNLISFLKNFSSLSISLKNTLSLFSFGISIPTVFCPGIVATLARC